MTRKKETLAEAYPSASAEWHPTKNGTITPRDVTPKSNTKYWWLCERGHEWESTIATRTKPSRCPYCFSRRVGKDNNLAAIHPNVAKQWHPSANGPLLPHDVLPQSNRRVWWQCGQGHEWEAKIQNRTLGGGCPYCSGRRAGPGYNLAIINPELVKDWHPTKNTALTPATVTPSSHKVVWWICKKGHEWNTKVNNRANGQGCPYCAGKRVDDSNNLAALFPELARQWHSVKNKDFHPRDVTPGSHRKAWWFCPMGHEWYAQIKSRVTGRGCPYCTNQTSALEIRVFCELRSIFLEAKWREKVSGVECDILLPTSNVAVEVDGYYWHKNKEEKEKKKNSQYRRLGFELIRLRDSRLSKLSENDIFFTEREKHLDIVIRLFKGLIASVDIEEAAILKSYISDSRLKNEKGYRKMLSHLPAPPPETSLVVCFPELAQEWHLTKNFPLTPNLFLPYSSRRVWWSCEKGHEWQATIASRSDGHGCPFCSGRKVGPDNNLTVLEPEIAAEWHSTKNGRLTPCQVTRRSNRKVWWVCNVGHEWQANVADRTGGRGCPYCSGRRASHTNNISAVRPDLVKEWHPSKNGALKPREFSPQSNKRVWWQCSRGHEWETRIQDRFKGTNCPYCAGKRVCQDNNLTALHPAIAAEWQPTKNLPLVPAAVRPGSHKKVWWRCQKGHEWEAEIKRRVQGRRCPFCFGRRKSERRK